MPVSWRGQLRPDKVRDTKGHETPCMKTNARGHQGTQRNLFYLTTKRYAGGLPMVVLDGSWYVDDQDKKGRVLKMSEQ